MSRRLFAVGGGLMFVGSLLFFVASYAWRFDAPLEPPVGTVEPILVDLALFTLFAMHHSIFARDGFRQWIRGIAGADLERSVYVWIASALFLLTCALWRTVPGVLWQATGPIAVVLRVGQLAGGLLAVRNAMRLDSLELAGLRQVMPARRATTAPPLVDEGGGYALVRHPVYLGWLLLVWLAPVMNGTRLVFAAISTFYLVLAVPFEERDLVRRFPGSYDAYRSRVRWRFLPFVY